MHVILFHYLRTNTQLFLGSPQAPSPIISCANSVGNAGLRSIAPHDRYGVIPKPSGAAGGSVSRTTTFVERTFNPSEWLHTF